MVHFLQEIKVFKRITNFGRSLFGRFSMGSILKSTVPHLVQDLISPVMALSPRPFIKLSLAQQDGKISILECLCQFAVSKLFLGFQYFTGFRFHHAPVHRIKIISAPVPLVFCIARIFKEHFPYRPILVFFHSLLIQTDGFLQFSCLCT